ncbi:MAG: hypothetical protein KBA75_03330 [Alphaproteobacteria bacterium]|nr:hypothetical protein [Alphaproteobacteria bacterium]
MRLWQIFGLVLCLILGGVSAPALADDALRHPISTVTLPAEKSSDLYAGNGKLCSEALTVCARAMQPLGVPVGGSFTVKIEEHFTATYECIMLDGKPHWAATAQQGSCAPQPVILLPAKYDADDPWNIG